MLTLQLARQIVTPADTAKENGWRISSVSVFASARFDGLICITQDACCACGGGKPPGPPEDYQLYNIMLSASWLVHDTD